MLSKNMFRYVSFTANTRKPIFALHKSLCSVRFKSSKIEEYELEDHQDEFEYSYELENKGRESVDNLQSQSERSYDFDNDGEFISKKRDGFHQGKGRREFSDRAGGFDRGRGFRGGFGRREGGFSGDRGGFGGGEGGFSHDRGGFGGGEGGFRRGNFDGGDEKGDWNSLGDSLRPKDWSQLQPFEKNFYKEHPDVTARSEEEVEAFRKNHDMRIAGKRRSETPRPIQDFEEAGFPESITAKIKALQWPAPSPIQAQGWPVVLSGRDVVGIANTGSGKTAAFILPAIVHIKNQRPLQRREGPICLVLVPTRELCQQVSYVSHKFGRKQRVRTTAVFGGSPKYGQIRQLEAGSEVVVATPGRLLDLLTSEAIDLGRVTFLVLDEADRMLEMGFEPSIRKIISQIRPDRQTVMWSATWPPEVQELATDFLSNYIKLTMGSDQLRANPRIEQIIKICPPHQKEAELKNILDEIEKSDDRKTLIFTSTKVAADNLGHRMKDSGYPVAVIHGDKRQGARDAVMKNFRNGRAEILIATDVAARGLDVSDIRYVINFDMPTNIEDYVHRIGRTARGDRSGTAYTLFVPNVPPGLAMALVQVLKETNQYVDPVLETYASSRTRGLESRGRSRYRAVRPKFNPGDEEW